MGVYLFKDQHAFRLERGYVFREAPAPAELYELMPQTIPVAIQAAGQGVAGRAGDYAWGVLMPPRIATQISRLARNRRSGELVINRFGEVRHVPAKTTTASAYGQTSKAGG